MIRDMIAEIPDEYRRDAFYRDLTNLQGDINRQRNKLARPYAGEPRVLDAATLRASLDNDDVHPGLRPWVERALRELENTEHR